MKPQVLSMLSKNKGVERERLSHLISGGKSAREIYHMHASRQGPFNANEIYLAIQEKSIHPELEIINGVLQPSGTVSKFLNYWLAGLGSNLVDRILSKLVINSKKPLENRKLDLKLLNSLASEVYGNGERLFNSLVQPILEEHSIELSRVGFKQRDLEGLRAMLYDEDLSLEDMLISSSEYLINIPLKKHRQPVFRMKRLKPRAIGDLSFKYISKDFLVKEHLRLIGKKKRQYNSAYSFILKELKGYGEEFPSPEKLERIFKRCSRADKSFSNLSISSEEVRAIFDNVGIVNKEKILSAEEGILLSILAYTKCIKDRQGGSDTIQYLDGKNMIQAMFETASANRSQLVLQEFIRGTDYSVYERLISKYSNLDVRISACRTWDTNKFPEFDSNLVRGFRYLAR